MPGTPDPVFGSDTTTLILALLLSTGIIAATIISVRRSSRPTRIAIVSSTVYALLAVSTWFGVRQVFYRHVIDPVAEWGAFVFIVGIGVIALTVQAAIPLVLYARRGYLIPLIGLLAVTTIVYFVFLRVGGESDPLGLYAFAFAPLVIAGLCVLAGVEAAVRKFLVPNGGFGDELENNE